MSIVFSCQGKIGGLIEFEIQKFRTKYFCDFCHIVTYLRQGNGRSNNHNKLKQMSRYLLMESRPPLPSFMLASATLRFASAKSR